jgi:hypothetical protein
MSVTAIDLPAIKLIEHSTCGSIVHVVEPQRRTQVLSTGAVKISARTEVPLWTLDTGEKVAVTSRPNVELPDGVDGVLRQTGQHLGWLTHRKLIEIRERIATNGWHAESEAIRATWKGNFRYQKEEHGPDGSLVRAGLRAPQYGALHSIAAHWSLDADLATVVMPTGTGKTETMIAALVAETDGVMMVVVPTRALKEQTIRKFETLGLLRELGCLGTSARNPIVGKVLHRPTTEQDVDFFAGCNVIIGNVQALAQGTAAEHAAEMAKSVRVLVVDEAHHVAANTWNEFRAKFSNRRILQFTATPIDAMGCSSTVMSFSRIRWVLRNVTDISSRSRSCLYTRLTRGAEMWRLLVPRSLN